MAKKKASQEKAPKPDLFALLQAEVGNFLSETGLERATANHALALFSKVAPLPPVTLQRPGKDPTIAKWEPEATPRNLVIAYGKHLKAQLDKMKAAYEKGSKIKILEAAAYCGGMGLPLPSWITDGLKASIERYQTCEVKTLDEAFGMERPKGFPTKAWARRLKLWFPVYFSVERSRLNGEGLGDSLFDAIGEEFGISAKTVSKYYYAVRKGYFGLMTR